MSNKNTKLQEDIERLVQTDADVVSEKFWADIAEKNKVMRAFRESKGKDYDWFDSCKPDEHD